MSLRVVGEGFAAPMFTQVKRRRAGYGTAWLGRALLVFGFSPVGASVLPGCYPLSWRLRFVAFPQNGAPKTTTRPRKLSFSPNAADVVSVPV